MACFFYWQDISCWHLNACADIVSLHLQPLLDGYHEGMATGDTGSALYCIYFYILLSYQAGKQLDLLEADCILYRKQAQEKTASLPGHI